MSDVTRILTATEQGDPQAADKLLPRASEELRQTVLNYTAPLAVFSDQRFRDAARTPAAF